MSGRASEPAIYLVHWKPMREVAVRGAFNERTVTLGTWLEPELVRWSSAIDSAEDRASGQAYAQREQERAEAEAARWGGLAHRWEYLLLEDAAAVERWNRQCTGWRPRNARPGDLTAVVDA